MPARMNLRDVGDGPDFYPTPSWAVRALCDNVKFVGGIVEPCCGMGHMSRALSAEGYDVRSSDLHDRGFGETGKCALTLTGPIDNIVTNPPYSIASDLLPGFLDACHGKVALLLRMSFLESRRRYALFQRSPPAVVLVFSERLSMAPHGVDVRGGGTISYAWFVWDCSCRKGVTELRWIPPGYKTKGLE